MFYEPTMLSFMQQCLVIVCLSTLHALHVNHSTEKWNEMGISTSYAQDLRFFSRFSHCLGMWGGRRAGLFRKVGERWS